MRFNAKRNAKKNIVFGVLENFVKIICPFIVRTMIIKLLGENYIGVNSLFTSFISILSLAELGFDTAIACVMYDAVAKNENSTLCALLKYLKRVYVIVGTVILIVGLLCVPFIKFIIKDPQNIPGDINTIVVYLIFLFDVVIGYYVGAYKNSIINAFQRRDIISNIYSISMIITTILQIVVLVISRKYIYFLLIKPLATIMQNVFVVIISRVLYPDIKPKGKLNDNIIKKVNKIVQGTFCGTVGAKLSVSFDNIIISSMLGIAVLSRYSNYIYIISALQCLILVLTTSLKAIIGNKVNTDSVESNYILLRKLTLIFIWIDSWCTITLFYLIQKFIVIWLGSNSLLPLVDVVSFSLYFYISVSDGIFQMFKEALGIFWEDRFRALTGGLVNLLLNILMVIILRKINLEYALSGVVLSTSISQIFILIPWATNVTFNIYFKVGKKSYYKQLIMGFKVMIISALATLPWIWCLDRLVNNIFVNFVMTGIICMIIPNICMWLQYRKFEYYDDTMLFVKNLKKQN